MLDRNEMNQDLAEALQDAQVYAIWIEGNRLRFRVFPSDATFNERLVVGGVLDQNSTVIKSMGREFRSQGKGVVPEPNHHIITHDGQSWRVEKVVHSDLTDDVDMYLSQHE